MTKTFQPLVLSNFFFVCSMPLNLDSYRYCPFQCEYCFMKNRVIGKRQEIDMKPNINWLRNKFKKVFDDKNVNKTNFIEMLLRDRITVHFGTKSEPFPPNEKIDQHTKEIVELCNQYDLEMMFTTKSDNIYDVDVDSKLHTFQLSITNHYTDRYLEPNAPSFEKRVEFYKELKDAGFKVGLRFEPFIPNITDVIKCLEYFDDVDIVHISTLIMLPQLNHDKMMEYIGITKSDCFTYGTTKIKEDILYEYLKPTIKYLEENNYSYSTRFVNYGNNKCCCGDCLVNNTITFDVHHLHHKYGDNWTLQDGINEMGEYKDCRCDYVYTSNRRKGMKTVEEFYKYKWENNNPPFLPKNQFKPKKTLFDF